MLLSNAFGQAAPENIAVSKSRRCCSMAKLHLAGMVEIHAGVSRATLAVAGSHKCLGWSHGLIE
jgi:hypothetical protein